jgi:RimJ/RimL family protein N-acetyltransferase
MMIFEDSNEIDIRHAKVQDLELMLAWRSNPEIYRHFKKQDGPLEWSEHLDWFRSRHEDREDFIIEYKGRRVGSVSVDEEGYLGIYIGETAAQGNRIGEYAVKRIVEKYAGDRELKAEIKEENEVSIALFESLGFKEIGRENSWIKYHY